jgi:hypothetical protein
MFQLFDRALNLWSLFFLLVCIYVIITKVKSILWKVLLLGIGLLAVWFLPVFLTNTILILIVVFIRANEQTSSHF